VIVRRVTVFVELKDPPFRIAYPKRLLPPFVLFVAKWEGPVQGVPRLWLTTARLEKVTFTCHEATVVKLFAVREAVIVVPAR